MAAAIRPSARRTAETRAHARLPAGAGESCSPRQGSRRAKTRISWQRGELLFHIGGCTNCHTAKNGPSLAGGDAIATPFGTSTRRTSRRTLTPGSVRWSLDQFVACHARGPRPAGLAALSGLSLHLLHPHERRGPRRLSRPISDTLPAVSQPSKPHELRFPFNLRLGLYLWQWLFFTPERFAPDPARDAAWNRGAYLVLGPGHCGECHTPRTFYGVLEWNHAFAGGQLGKDKVPNITPNPTAGIGKWSDGDVSTLLTARHDARWRLRRFRHGQGGQQRHEQTARRRRRGHRRLSAEPAALV